MRQFGGNTRKPWWGVAAAAALWPGVAWAAEQAAADADGGPGVGGVVKRLVVSLLELPWLVAAGALGASLLLLAGLMLASTPDSAPLAAASPTRISDGSWYGMGLGVLALAGAVMVVTLVAAGLGSLHWLMPQP